jgi:maltose-binding protein MalE
MQYSFPSNFFIKSITVILLLSIILAGCDTKAARPEGGYPPVENMQEATQTPTDSIEIERMEIPSPVVLQELKQEISVTETSAPTSTLSGTITLWHSWTDNELVSLKQIVNDFQKKNPKVAVELKYIPFDDLPTRFASSIDGEGPDLLLGSSGWGPELYDAGLVADVSRIAKPKFFEKIGEGALETVRYKNALIGLPISYNRGVVIFRNRSVLSEIPQTLAEYLESAVNVTRGDIIGAVIDLGFFYSGAYLSACGGSLMDARGFPLFENPTGLCWVELLKSIQESGLPVVFNSDLDLERFKTSKTGFIIAGTWDTASLAEAIGYENLAIDPWPDTEKDHLSGFIETDVVYLNANVNPENLVAARSLVRYFLAERAQRNLSKSTADAKIPVVKGIEISDRLMEEAVVALENGTPLPGMPAMDYYWGPMDQAIQSILMGREDPKQALGKAANQIDVRVRTPRR